MHYSRRGAIGRLGAALTALLGTTTTSAAATLAQEATPDISMGLPLDFKVVLHAAQEQNWPYVLSNLTNLAREWPQARVRVVIDGSAVYSLQGQNDFTTKLGQVAAPGVEFQVCRNALHDHAIDPATIPSYIKVVPGGVPALVAAQVEGFAYVKP